MEPTQPIFQISVVVLPGALALRPNQDQPIVGRVDCFECRLAVIDHSVMPVRVHVPYLFSDGCYEAMRVVHHD
jgi:hypothetical protein